MAERRPNVSGEAVAIIGAAVGLLGVLVPLMLYLHGRLAADLAATRTELRADVATLRADLRGDVAEVRADVRALTVRVDALTERVARIEGAMNPWRPANGAPAPSTPPEAEAAAS